MKFGPTRLADAEGALLAHAMRLAGRSLKKGHVLDGADIAGLRREGHEEVIAARLEPGDVGENEAAARLAESVMGPGLKLDTAFTGRANLRADAPGLAVLDEPAIDAINAVDERLTVATVAPFHPVAARGIAATVKVIPFAAPGAVLDTAMAIAREKAPVVRIAAFAPRRVGLIQTVLPNLKPGLLQKTVEATRARLAGMGAQLARSGQTAHAEAEVAAMLEAYRKDGIAIALVLGASAIVDRRDVIPTALAQAGGSIDRLGMPIDPGNLTMLGRLGAMHILGLPGSARSTRLHGFDWVLQRLVAGVPITGSDIAAMGVGGLLKEIASRPQPREGRASTEPAKARVAAVVLAAGQSRRMGRINKLLAEIDGAPMIVRTVETVMASGANPIVVATGHQADRVRAAIGERPVRFVHNPDYAKGLASSLQAALAGIPDDVDGAVFCLGDMPRVTPAHLDRLIEAFAGHDRPAICVPTHNGKRGNPVLWHRRFFEEMAQVAGDTGARHLIGEHAESVIEVAIDNDGVLLDIDTPEALSAAQGETGQGPAADAISSLP